MIIQNEYNNDSYSLGGRSVYQIDKRYPVGISGEIPTITIKKDVTVDFNCSSYDPWLSCIWKAPFTSSPCPMFLAGTDRYGTSIFVDTLQLLGYFRSKSDDCSDWSSTSNYQIRYEEKNGLHVCSIHGKIGIDQNHPDEVTKLN